MAISQTAFKQVFKTRSALISSVFPAVSLGLLVTGLLADNSRAVTPEFRDTLCDPVRRDPQTGWLGYDFVVNRSGVKTDTTTIERNIGGKYQWGSSVEIRYHSVGNELELAVPRSALGLGEGKVTIDFKWADNIQQAGDWSDFTLNSAAAPNDRFNYRPVLGLESGLNLNPPAQ